MMDPAILRAMYAAGAGPEVLIAAVEAAKAADDLKLAERRERAAAKKRRQRETKAAAMSPDVPGTDRDRPGQTGTEGDTKLSLPPNGPPSPEPLPPLNPPTHKRILRATSFPDDFEASQADRDCARQQGVETAEALAHVIAHWQDHHTAKGSTFKDWHASLRTWLRSPYQKSTGPPGGLFVVNGHGGGVNGRAHKAGNGYTAGGSRGDVFLAAMAEQFAGGGAVDERDADDPGEQGPLRGPTIDGKIVGRGDR